jgi:hypothetical protein
MKVNTNLFAVVGAAYAIDCFFCLMVSRSSIRSILGALWALGPPANLIHGTDYLVPFALGTLVVAGTLRAAIRARTRETRIFLLVVLVTLWALSGFIAYAPGA